MHQNTDSQKFSATKVIYRFLGGTLLGTLIIAIPISYGSSIHLNLIQFGVASLLILSCGVLSGLWGEKFIDIVTRVLNGIGF